MIYKNKLISPEAIAAWFINRTDREAGDSITHLKLQKLLYYAQAWYLANFDRPLFKEEFEAWTHGPVCPTIYDKYKASGWGALEREPKPTLSEELEKFLEAVYEEYGQYSAKKLELLTHEEGPWKKVRGNLAPEMRCNTPIDKLLMRNYYAARLEKKPISKLCD